MSFKEQAILLASVMSIFSSASSVEAEDVVTYEKFGAVGDGVHDDLPAICRAHEYANARGLPVSTKPDATYHLSRTALTAIIATNTDWNTSRFTIDGCPFTSVGHPELCQGNHVQHG
jgi:hypothetical protein